MDNRAANKILQSPFPDIAAAVRWDWEQFAQGGGLRAHLDGMVRAGIMSEVLDLIEALRVPPEEATEQLAQTYERAALGARLIAAVKPEIAEQDLRASQDYSNRAAGLRDGSITIDEELAARAVERQANGHESNFYVSILEDPIFFINE